MYETNPTQPYLTIYAEQQVELKQILLNNSIQVQIPPIIFDLFSEKISSRYYYYLADCSLSLFKIGVEGEIQLRLILGGKPNAKRGKSTRMMFERIGIYNPYTYLGSLNERSYSMSQRVIEYENTLHNLLPILKALDIEFESYQKILLENLFGSV